YLRAKRRLFEDYAPSFAVLNCDDPAAAELRAGCPAAIVGFSTRDSGAEFTVRDARIDGRGIEARVHTPAGEVQLLSPLLGRHNLSNALAVLATEFCLGADMRQVAAALQAHPGAPGRLERVASAQDRPFVFVDYAHTEDALDNVLRALRTV